MRRAHFLCGEILGQDLQDSLRIDMLILLSRLVNPV
jgi:hypothetical protein